MSKIAFFSALYDPHVGGVERYTKNLAAQLVRNGHSVYVITSNLYGEEEYQEKDGVIVIRVPCFSFFDGRLPIVKKRKSTKVVEKHIGQMKFDLAVVNTRFYNLSFIASKLAAKKKWPCIGIEHGSSYIAFGRWWIDWIVRLYERIMTVRVKRYCRHYYGVSKDASQWLKTFGIQSDGEIHNAIDVTECADEAKSQKEAFPLLSNNNGLVVVYLGRVTERKGILELNEAVAKLLPLFPGIKLWILGDGDLMVRLRQEKRETTEILGAVPHDVAMALVSRADVFVLASETEGFPTSVLEAMACKTFVVTTYAGGSKEIITDRSFGMLIEDNSVQTIYAALKEVLADSRYRQLAEEKCFARVKENYSWGASARIIENIIDKGLGV